MNKYFLTDGYLESGLLTEATDQAVSCQTLVNYKIWFCHSPVNFCTHSPTCAQSIPGISICAAYRHIDGRMTEAQ